MRCAPFRPGAVAEVRTGPVERGAGQQDGGEYVSTAAIAIIAENVVILAAIGARWSLLRQGGGLQEKTPPVPKKAPGEPSGADNTVPIGKAERSAA